MVKLDFVKDPRWFIPIIISILVGIFLGNSIFNIRYNQITGENNRIYNENIELKNNISQLNSTLNQVYGNLINCDSYVKYISELNNVTINYGPTTKVGTYVSSSNGIGLVCSASAPGSIGCSSSVS